MIPNLGLHPWCADAPAFHFWAVTKVHSTVLQGRMLFPGGSSKGQMAGLENSTSCLLLTQAQGLARSGVPVQQLYSLASAAATMPMSISPIIPLPCHCVSSNCYFAVDTSAVNTGTQCGLDHARADGAGFEEQAAVFSQQLCLGKELQRPISVWNHPQYSITHKGLMLLCSRKLPCCLGSSMVWLHCRCTA